MSLEHNEKKAAKMCPFTVILASELIYTFSFLYFLFNIKN